jgi:AraC-like DNA-binding protein
MNIKDMIARCLERMRARECATCDNRKICPAGRWQQAFSPPRNEQPRGGRGERGVAGGLMAFLGQVAASFDAPQASLRGAVEAELEAMLASGDVSIDRVAAKLGISRQTLYRRLKAEGVTFEELLEAMRRKLAIRYLERERLSVKAAAYRLGFSEPAAFSRAFKRWTGASPSRFREASAG